MHFWLMQLKKPHNKPCQNNAVYSQCCIQKLPHWIRKVTVADERREFNGPLAAVLGAEYLYAVLGNDIYSTHYLITVRLTWLSGIALKMHPATLTLWVGEWVGVQAFKAAQDCMLSECTDALSGLQRNIVIHLELFWPLLIDMLGARLMHVWKPQIVFLLSDNHWNHILKWLWVLSLHEQISGILFLQESTNNINCHG